MLDVFLGGYLFCETLVISSYELALTGMNSTPRLWYLISTVFGKQKCIMLKTIKRRKVDIELKILKYQSFNMLYFTHVKVRIETITLADLICPSAHHTDV